MKTFPISCSILVLSPNFFYNICEQFVLRYLVVFLIQKSRVPAKQVNTRHPFMAIPLRSFGTDFVPYNLHADCTTGLCIISLRFFGPHKNPTLCLFSTSRFIRSARYILFLCVIFSPLPWHVFTGL